MLHYRRKAELEVLSNAVWGDNHTDTTVLVDYVIDKLVKHSAVQ